MGHIELREVHVRGRLLERLQLVVTGRLRQRYVGFRSRQLKILNESINRTVNKVNYQPDLRNCSASASSDDTMASLLTWRLSLSPVGRKAIF